MPLAILGTDVTLICHRRRARLSPRTMAPSPSKKNSGLAKPTLADVYRMMEELFDRLDRKLENLFDRSDKKLDERAQEMSVMDQRASSLKQDARQPRLAIGADGQADTNTRERRRAPLQQFKRCMGIYVFRTGLIPTGCVLPASVVTPPDLRLSLVQGMMPW